MNTLLRFCYVAELLLVIVSPVSAQTWFFAYDGTADLACTRSAEGNNPFFQSEPTSATCYWEIVDNGLGGKALHQFANDPSKTMRWRGYGSRPEYYRGPCDAFAMENFKPGRQAFTLTFRLKADSYDATAGDKGTRIFNCEYQTTIPNPYSTGGYSTYTFRIEFCVRLSGGNLILQDFRFNDVLGILKQASQPATWHTVWAMVTVPPGLNQANSIYRLWFDGTEVNWTDRDKGGWSDCEFGSNDSYGDISWDYLCYGYEAWLPGQIAVPGETPKANTNGITGLKAYPNGTPCELTNKIVTGIYVEPAAGLTNVVGLGMTNYFIAEPDGSDGIRVRHHTGLLPKSAQGTTVVLQVGDMVTVRGGLMSPACEKQISAHEIIRTAAGNGQLPFAPPVLDNALIGSAYDLALYEEQPAQLFTNLLSGTITATNGTMITDSTKAWTPGFLNHRTVYLPATSTRSDRYYYVYTNSANTLDIRHRTIEFNIPNLAADGVKLGDPYQFSGTLGEVLTLQDIWDRSNYASAWTPPAGLRIHWKGVMPAQGNRVAAKGGVGAERFKHQVASNINGSLRDEVRIDKVYPFLAADSVAPLVPPVLTPVGLTAAGFVAQVSLTPGEPYRIRASTDVQTWVDITNFVAATTNYYLLDPAATAQPRRFYQAVSP
jgi:hypothetical protein